MIDITYKRGTHREIRHSDNYKRERERSLFEERVVEIGLATGT